MCDLNMKRFVCVFSDISPFCSLVTIEDDFYDGMNYNTTPGMYYQHIG